MNDSMQALADLRVWTDSTVDGTQINCSTIKDEWEYNQSDCKYNYTSICTADATTDKLCYVINDCSSDKIIEKYSGGDNCPSNWKNQVQTRLTLAENYAKQIKQCYLTSN